MLSSFEIINVLKFQFVIYVQWHGFIEGKCVIKYILYVYVVVFEQYIRIL